MRNLADPKVVRDPLVLKRADGTPYDGTTSDNEGLAVLPNGDYLVSSETEPSIRIYGRDGIQKASLPVPARFAVTGTTPDGQATSNATLEGLTISPSGHTIIAAMEGALSGDVSASGDATAHRFLVYTQDRHGNWALEKQVEYRTETGMRVPEVAAYSDDAFLVEEASFSPITGNAVDLYAVSGLKHATDVSGVAEPVGRAGRRRARQEARRRPGEGADAGCDTARAAGEPAPRQLRGDGHHDARLAARARREPDQRRQLRRGAADPGAQPPGQGAANLTESTGSTGPGSSILAVMKESDEPAAQPALRVDGLSVAYGQRTAVDGIGFQIERGEIFGLLGPNGAGKTSTLSAIEGLVKPAAGQVLVDGVDARERPLEAKARLGVQLQSSSFQPELSIEQIARLYGGLYGVRLTGEQISTSMRAIGLDQELGKRFKQLSGGQQQRLALYIATIHEPLLLLLDEPTAGLDPQSRRALWRRIEQLRGGGSSILLTTHSMEEAQAVCDRVAIIDHGSLLTIGSPSDLITKHKDDPRVREVAHGPVTLEDVFIGLTGSEIRD